MQGNTLANKSAKDRPPTDFFPTPPNVTTALINFLNLPNENVVWECACGEGHMSEVIKSLGYEVVSTELNDTGYGENGVDFLNCELRKCDWIITNPPFNVSSDFIKRSIEHKKPFALLLKSQYWHALNKTKLFNEFKPKYVLPLNWRPDFLFGKKGGKPTMECLWVVYDNCPSDITQYEILEKPDR